MNVMQVHVSMLFATITTVASVALAKRDSLLVQARLIASISMNVQVLTLVALMQNARILLVLTNALVTMDIVATVTIVWMLTNVLHHHVTMLQVA
jgi:hypothetical protein